MKLSNAEDPLLMGSEKQRELTKQMFVQIATCLNNPDMQEMFDDQTKQFFSKFS